MRRTPGRFTDDGTIEGEPDPLAEAGRDLAHRVQLAELRGPWQLDARLAAPEIGKSYWRPRHPARPDELAGALGLPPGGAITHEHVRRSREQVDAEVTAEIGRLPVPRPAPPRALDAARFPGQDRQHVAARLRPAAEFLADPSRPPPTPGSWTGTSWPPPTAPGSPADHPHRHLLVTHPVRHG